MSIYLHLRHEVRPERFIETLRCIHQNKLINVVQSERQLARAKMLGLLSDDETLTPEGNVFVRLAEEKANVINDIAHFLHYAGWHQEKPSANAQLLFYKTFCDYVYNSSNFNFKSERDKLETVIFEVSGLIEQDEAITPLLTNKISLSPDTIYAATYWLEALDPPVIINNTFRRRHFCHPELLLLALGYMVRDEPDAVGVNILLSQERRQTVCQLCLLDPSAFDSTLDWMLPLYPHIVSADPDVGYYGRYIRLHRLPSLEDLPR